MAFRKKTKKVEEVVADKTTTKIESEVTDVEIEEVIETPKVKSKTIKKGSKIVISGRLFGSSKLECPMGTVKDYSTKILDIENGNYLIDKGWISPKGLKD